MQDSSTIRSTINTEVTPFPNRRENVGLPDGNDKESQENDHTESENEENKTTKQNKLTQNLETLHTDLEKLARPNEPIPELKPINPNQLYRTEPEIEKEKFNTTALQCSALGFFLLNLGFVYAH